MLVGKAEVFYDCDDIELQAKIALATLVLGASHNRWYVEKKFLKFAGPDISDSLANRIIAEVEVEDINFRKYFEHLEFSISATSAALHPVLKSFLGSS